MRIISLIGLIFFCVVTNAFSTPIKVSSSKNACTVLEDEIYFCSQENISLNEKVDMMNLLDDHANLEISAMLKNNDSKMDLIRKMTQLHFELNMKLSEKCFAKDSN